MDRLSPAPSRAAGREGPGALGIAAKEDSHPAIDCKLLLTVSAFVLFFLGARAARSVITEEAYWRVCRSGFMLLRQSRTGGRTDWGR
jgi:hypothetical protein